MSKNNDYDIPKVRDSFIESLNRSRRKRRLILILSIAGAALITGVCVAVALNIINNNRIAEAKNVVVQMDIKSTFKVPEFHDKEDWDNDGLTNEKEQREGTNLQNVDTDGDGLSDGDEIKLGTDPLKSDTDGDGLIDGYEVMAGINPRMAMTDGKTKDSERVLTITKTAGEAVLTVEGNANIADASIEELDLFAINSNASIVSKAYDSYCANSFKSAEISFKLDKKKIEKLGYSLDELSILHFDTSTRNYSKVSSQVDSKGEKISAKIDKLGTYVVGAPQSVNKQAQTRVCFLIDNSGSMYPKSKCADSTENDVNFKRLDFAASLVDKFADNYQTAICKYTGSYTKICGFTSDKEQVKSALDSIKKTDEYFNGTYSQTAILSCISEFTEQPKEKYKNIIVMLTDGESDETNPATLQNIEAKAKEKNIVILTVGLGRDVDRQWLHELATETSGRYYSASDADALESVYQQIVTTLNFDIVQYDHKDDNILGYSLYNTGFDPYSNGFSFKNFRTSTTTGVDYGMAVFARDWYLGEIKPKLSTLKPSEKSEQKVDGLSYNLEGTEILKAYEERKSLYDYKSDMLSGKYADVKEYLDYNSSGKLLEIKKDYRNDVLEKGWIIQNTNVDSGNIRWKTVELLALDVANGLDKIKSGYSNDEAQLAAALYRLNVLRWDDQKDEYSLTQGEKCFEKLKAHLSLGEPVVTTVDDKHTVNSIALIQDAKCHRKYVLQVYDNNYPGQTKEIYIEKKPINVLDESGNISGSDFVYTATYEGKQVGVAFSDVEEH